MEGIHGVDISWLHHSQKDQRTQKSLQSPANGSPIADGDGGKLLESALDTSALGFPSPKAVDDSAHNSHHLIHRPHLHSRQSSEKLGQATQASPKSPKESKATPVPQPTRRGSWISNISSKFSSSASPPIASPNGASQSVNKPLPNPQTEQRESPSLEILQDARDIKKPETSPLQSPQQSPKSGSGSFIHNALRRLSSSGGVSLGKMSSTGGVCQRRVMNIDPHRERCQIDDLQPAKLRRVAFCVDVEIAGAARYADEEPDEHIPPPPGRRPSLTQLEVQVEAKKAKDKKIKERSEGETLKNPQCAADEKEKIGDVKATEERVMFDKVDADAAAEKPKDGDAKEPTTRKKDKKKRSEEERKERKERKKREAVDSGSVPVELSRGDSSSTGDSSNGAVTPAKPQDRPTTDPLRIYRRCCQLRETSILKRVAEQLAPQSACDPMSPGTILCLDLSGYCMQLPDTITLGDYLAVVPVKKLILENCDLTDEAVRVLLAGLLAAKTPEQAKFNRNIAKKATTHRMHEAERLGVIEKLSLKNNPNIGRDGWRHIGLFIYMSRSLKAIDLSMIPFPQPVATGSGLLIRSTTNAKFSIDVSNIFEKALGLRLAGARLEELVMGECGLDSQNIEKIVNGVIQCGATRLGLASNNMTVEGLQHVVNYVRTNKCEGLDLGGNDLSSNLDVLADALNEENSLYALSLADCNLYPSSLKPLYPALVRLPNFRFIDLSHNRDLFSTQPNALSLLRKYLPQLPLLKRLHLADVNLSSEHAIALAEVLPEIPSLAHLVILENPQISALAHAKDEASQEEACALYASLMAAVRVSDSIVCVDVDVPRPDSSEIVKALAKQVVAYSLRNMEHGPVAEAYASAAASIADPHGGEKYVNVPDILLSLVGHVDGFPDNHDDDEPAPDDDYIVGGTGVVKALGVCLGNKVTDHRRSSKDSTPAGSGTATPKQVLQDAEMTKGKAKNMSKNLLESARKIRARLQPAMVREARNGDEIGYRRLQFLDSTLERMIQRFEDEFPECRIEIPGATSPADDQISDSSLPSSFTNPFDPNGGKLGDASDLENAVSPDDAGDRPVRVPVSRHNSDVSVASRHLALEEGRMHRFGQQVRRDLLRPQTLDYAHGTTGGEGEAPHLQNLRLRIEAMDGNEIREKIERCGHEAAWKELIPSTEELVLLEKEDPEGFEKFRQSQLFAIRNSTSMVKDGE
ncbi:hypothetical protein MMC14_001454 [Varicellaria rhodocarpa]|nr:hypothetical protein [Varicellaria rhodocarpa]